MDGSSAQPSALLRRAYTRHKIPEALLRRLVPPTGVLSPSTKGLSRPKGLVLLLFQLVKQRLAQLLRVLYLLRVSASSLTKHLLKPVFKHPCKSLLIALGLAEGAFGLWWLGAYRRWTNYKLDDPVHDGPQAFERVLDFIQGFTGRPALATKLRAYISAWFLGTSWEELKLGNLEEHLAYSFFYKSPDAVRAAGQGELLQSMLEQLITSCELSDMAPGYAPNVKAMWHMEQPLQAVWLPLTWYLIAEVITGASNVAMWSLGFQKGRANGCVFWYLPPAASKGSWWSRRAAATVPAKAVAAPAKAVAVPATANGVIGPTSQGSTTSALAPGVLGSVDGQRSTVVEGPSRRGVLPRIPSPVLPLSSLANWRRAATPSGIDSNALIESDLLAASRAARKHAAELLASHAAAHSCSPTLSKGSPGPAPSKVMVLDNASLTRTANSAGASSTGSTVTSRVQPAAVTPEPDGRTQSSKPKKGGDCMVIDARGPRAVPGGLRKGSQSCPTFQDLVNAAEAAAEADAAADATIMHRQQQLQEEQTGGVAQPVPMVFLHGVGIGLLPYFGVVWGLQHGAKKAGLPLLVMQFKHVSLRLCKTVPTADTAATTVVAALNQLGLTQACVIAHSYGTFVASRLTQMFPHRVKGLALIDPVCFGMFLPNLLGKFVYAPGRRDTWWHFIKDGAVRLAASELHCAATFCRRFYWHQVNLEACQLPAHSLVFLGGRDELLHGEEVATAIAEVAAERRGGAPSPFPLSGSRLALNTAGAATGAAAGPLPDPSPAYYPGTRPALHTTLPVYSLPPPEDVTRSQTPDVAAWWPQGLSPPRLHSSADPIEVTPATPAAAVSRTAAVGSRTPIINEITPCSTDDAAPAVTLAANASRNPAPAPRARKPLPPLEHYKAAVQAGLSQEPTVAVGPQDDELRVGGRPAGNSCSGPGTTLLYRPTMAHADFMFQSSLLTPVLKEVLQFAKQLGTCTKPCCKPPPSPTPSGLQQATKGP